ncbi:MAG TPA: zf-HC2 domain-containing protein [Candidatus Baltobacteraceae bacterium]|nr:zf-HC2 domain-containing protein [Candidatus Baltobacteraceae bacterium]
MKCQEARKRLPGYLDGAMRAQDNAGLRQHLDSCAECRDHLERYRLLSGYLGHMEPVPAPSDLALKIRMRASRERSPWAGLARLWASTLLVFENLLGPLAVPATGGVLTALGVFIFVVHGLLVGVPMNGVVPNDLPLNLVQPAELESLAPFPVPGSSGVNGQLSSQGLLLEATLNAQGEVVDYKILSGPASADVHHQLDQLLMFSRFRPQMNFGRPMDGGRVLLSFSEVRVHG